MSMIIMSVKDKYKNVFGQINSLSDKIPWTTGLSNMVEFLVWDTKSVLGISKAEFWKLIVAFTDKDEYREKNDAERVKFIEEGLKSLQAITDAGERYAKPKSGYCCAREALRRNKYFSEDYLNKEFDIFLNLSSDKYLDYFYGKFISLKKGGSWSSHGNSGLYSCSVNIEAMQMDNLAYNEDENLLIANELKLGGGKNKDQILKYCFMYKELERRQFIKANSRFMLLFISDKKESINLANEIIKEIEYCKKKPHLKYLLAENVLEVANHQLNVASISWSELIVLNELYMKLLNDDQQVEKKLLGGLNSSLKEKAFIGKEFIKYSNK